MYQNELYQNIAKYDKMLVFGVNFDIFGWLGVCTFGNIVFGICFKNGVFKSCFQQSAKGEITALSLR